MRVARCVRQPREGVALGTLVYVCWFCGEVSRSEVVGTGVRCSECGMLKSGGEVGEREMREMPDEY